MRIAGVNVGKVTKVEPLEDGSGKARVTMEIDDVGPADPARTRS